MRKNSPPSGHYFSNPSSPRPESSQRSPPPAPGLAALFAPPDSPQSTPHGPTGFHNALRPLDLWLSPMLTPSLREGASPFSFRPGSKHDLTASPKQPPPFSMLPEAPIQKPKPCNCKVNNCNSNRCGCSRTGTYCTGDCKCGKGKCRNRLPTLHRKKAKQSLKKKPNEDKTEPELSFRKIGSDSSDNFDASEDPSVLYESSNRRVTVARRIEKVEGLPNIDRGRPISMSLRKFNP